MMPITSCPKCGGPIIVVRMRVLDSDLYPEYHGPGHMLVCGDADAPTVSAGIGCGWLSPPVPGWPDMARTRT